MSESPKHQYVGRILFVDEDVAMRSVMALILRRDQFQVVTLPSAEEGLAQMKTDDPFDFVISGFALPGMNGLSFLHHVAVLSRRSVRILVSAWCDDSDGVNRSMREGYINRYVAKPFCFDTFRANLKNDLEGFNLTQ